MSSRPRRRAREHCHDLGVIGLDAGGGLLLALREAHLSSAVAQACRRNADRLAPTMPWARHEISDHDIAAYDVSTLHRLADGSALDLAILRGEQVLGVVNALIDAAGTAELGWWVDRDVEGTGVAHQAVATLAEHLIGRRGVGRLAARTLPADTRSNALAARLGMDDLGVVDGVCLHSTSADAWRQRHPPTGVELALAVDDELELVLTEPRLVPALHAMTAADLDRLRRWEPWAQSEQSPPETAAWWHGRMQLFARGEAYPLAARRRGQQGPDLLGSIGATIEPSSDVATIGYWLAEAATGGGVATRCVRRLVELLESERGVGHVGLSTAVDNVRSRVLAERCGFTYDRLLPAHLRIGGVEVDCVSYVRRR